MEKKKAYELLGIDENASIADVQTAYMKKRAENNEARFFRVRVQTKMS